MEVNQSPILGQVGPLNKLKNLFLILPFCFFSIIVNAQQVSNVRFKKVDKKIEIYYDLENSWHKNGIVQLFYSVDNGKTFKGPLKKVSGSVGGNQYDGYDKKIIWDVLNEIPELTGIVTFKVKYRDRKKFTIEPK
tara:strand:- start:448 stop:852 length:405 start_codon:yes stop_codon:yes gene_type:complete